MEDKSELKILERLAWPNWKIKEQRIKEAYMNGIDSLEEYKENKLLLAKERAELLEEKIKNSSAEPNRQYRRYDKK